MPTPHNNAQKGQIAKTVLIDVYKRQNGFHASGQHTSGLYRCDTN